MTNWQPIETAPKDGTPIILGGGTWGDDYRKESHCVRIGWWELTKDGDFWNTCAAEGGCSMFPYNNPTKWMPVPDDMIKYSNALIEQHDIIEVIHKDAERYRKLRDIALKSGALEATVAIGQFDFIKTSDQIDAAVDKLEDE